MSIFLLDEALSMPSRVPRTSTTWVLASTEGTVENVPSGILTEGDSSRPLLNLFRSRQVSRAALKGPDRNQSRWKKNSRCGVSLRDSIVEWYETEVGCELTAPGLSVSFRITEPPHALLARANSFEG